MMNIKMLQAIDMRACPFARQGFTRTRISKLWSGDDLPVQHPSAVLGVPEEIVMGMEREGGMSVWLIILVWAGALGAADLTVLQVGRPVPNCGIWYLPWGRMLGMLDQGHNFLRSARHQQLLL